MRLKPILSALAILTISGCSLFPQEAREVEIVTKPIKLDIIQPTLTATCRVERASMVCRIRYKDSGRRSYLS